MNYKIGAMRSVGICSLVGPNHSLPMICSCHGLNLGTLSCCVRMQLSICNLLMLPVDTDPQHLRLCKNGHLHLGVSGTPGQDDRLIHHPGFFNVHR